MTRRVIMAQQSRLRVLEDIFENEIGYLVRHYAKKRKGVPVKKH